MTRPDLLAPFDPIDNTVITIGRLRFFIGITTSIVIFVTTIVGFFLKIQYDIAGIKVEIITKNEMLYTFVSEQRKVNEKFSDDHDKITKIESLLNSKVDK